ncbi:MAG: SDR family NAD(P)-dependent oxidoreductase [Candidatus Binatia bacterium]
MLADPSFRLRYGPCALVAGAAVGLGAAYATQIAAQGLDLVLLDRDAGPLRATTDAIIAAHGVRVWPITIDLARADLIEALTPQLAGHEIGLLVYNAALGTVAPFLEMTPAHCETMLDVNCRAPMRLVHALAPAMVARRRGGIILMSSMSGDIGSAQLAVYAATKAFDRILADALWAELGPQGVDVLAVQPGSTRTPGWLSSQPSGPTATTFPAMEADDVVREALATLGVEPGLVPSLANRKAAEALARLPRRQAIEFLSGLTSQLIRNDPGRGAR